MDRGFFTTCDRICLCLSLTYSSTEYTLDGCCCRHVLGPGVGVFCCLEIIFRIQGGNK